MFAESSVDQGHPWATIRAVGVVPASFPAISVEHEQVAIVAAEVELVVDRRSGGETDRGAELGSSAPRSFHESVNLRP